MPDKSFGANTEVNPKEECKVLVSVDIERVELERKEEKEERKEERKGEDERKNKEEKKREENLKKIEKILPYPTECERIEKKRQFKDIFTHADVDLLVNEAWQQFSAQVKHMEQIYKRKRYIEAEINEYKVVKKKPIPPKVKDPGSFTTPCVIGKEKIRKTLLDLESSVNVTPLSIIERIGDLEVKPTEMTLLIADGSSKKPYGVVEDVMIYVGKLQFLVDFVVMEMEDERVPIILGRPFMKTAKVIIDVDEGMVVLQDQEERVIVDVFKEEQQMQKEEASHKATYQDVPMTSSTDTKPDFKGKKYFLSQVREEEKDAKGRTIHDDLMHTQHQLGKHVRFKKKLWVVKDFKEDGVIEIESPLSRRVKKVDRKQLMSWCDDKKMNTNIEDGT
ncbi:uncharacterized protein LOC128197720 [Vigna angularis]|uniref:uncharacterized protein LOC128197720 n=1 Tax=Phaseolus angularis TaxID=3914 RepID=UPI0022B2B574|nr:uncharacterized protein LOC128197720 [Vigna angularis]